MTVAEAREVLIRYNTWRRYNGPLEQTPLQPEPKEIGEAIDVAIEVLPKEEAEDASLEEAAEKYSDEYCWDCAYQPEYADAFKAGAEWQREHDDRLHQTTEG